MLLILAKFLNFCLKKKNFKSEDLDRDFQNYCFENILNITIHKGIKDYSYIAFIKKK